MRIHLEEPGKKTQKFSFPNNKHKVLIGRKPKTNESDEQILAIEEPTASRQHLMVRVRKGRIEIKDLNSSNGTQVNQQRIEGDKYQEVSIRDKIKMGESDKIIRIQIREKQKSSSSSDSSQSQEIERSRQKKKKANNSAQSLFSQFKISQSTLKMLKQMTADRKTKSERIKFLKLMGCKNIEDGWDKIEAYLKTQIMFNSSSKRAAEDLEKQFTLGRSNAQKKGLGRH